MIRKVVLGVLLVVVAAVLGATVLREPIAVAAAPIQNVIVGNTTANPVPVTQQGTANVAVTGTANVNVVDTREPFQRRIFTAIPDGSTVNFATFTVPAGKRFVAEYLSVIARVPPEQGVAVTWEGNAIGGGVPLHPGGVLRFAVGDFVSWAGETPLVAYHNAGDTFTVRVDRISSTVVKRCLRPRHTVRLRLRIRE